MQTRILRYLPESREYKYVEAQGRFLTNVLKTTSEPIVGDTKNLKVT